MRVAVVVLFVVSAGGCHIFSSALPCGDDSGCEAFDVCTDGYCQPRGDVVGEGEGEGGEGEGEEGEGEGEGEGDEGEGEEGEGEGEGDVVGEGEGEGEEGEGEGEGDVGGEGEGEPVDPCPPLIENRFTVNFGPNSPATPNTTATVVNDNRMELVSQAQPGHGFAGLAGPIGTYRGQVLEVEMNVTSRGSRFSEGGFQLGAKDASGFAIRIDIYEGLLGMVALMPNGVDFEVASNPIAQETGVISAQLRLDGVHPVANVNGVVMELTGVLSSAVQNHGIDVLAGCETFACSGASATVTRVALYNACRPPR